MMKRLLRIFIPAVTLVMLSMSSGTASAAHIFPGCNKITNANNSTVCKDVNAQNASGKNVLITIIKDVINVLSFIIGVAAVIIIIISAFKFIVAGGNTQSVSQARSGLIAAAIGIIVVVVAQGIVVFVLNRL